MIAVDSHASAMITEIDAARILRISRRTFSKVAPGLDIRSYAIQGRRGALYRREQVEAALARLEAEAEARLAAAKTKSKETARTR